jgi:hypothetical protein
MKTYLNAALAAERRRDFERATGCCTALLEHRRALTRAVGRRLNLTLRRRRAAEPMACCA